MSARIHFIGTNHIDPLGSERLWRALKYEKPDEIAVECSPELWQYINSGKWLAEEKKKLKVYTKRGLNNSAYKFILDELEHRQNFEPRVSLEHGKGYNIPVHLVDSRVVLDEILKRHKSPSLPGDIWHINKLSNNELRLQHSEETYLDFSTLFSSYAERALSYEHRIAAGQHETGAFIGRDLYAEKKIRALAGDNINLIIVYGLAHCLHDRSRNSLFSRLQDFNPTRATLKWYEDK